MAESAEAIVYVVDASSWISIEGNPAANKILYSLSSMVDRGVIKCPREVADELKHCEYVKGWLHLRRKEIVHNIRQKIEYLQLIGQVAISFPAMSGVRSMRNKADPYVVAYAAYRTRTTNPTKFVVVCDETLKNRPNRKIPTACEAFGVECITLMETLSREFPDEAW